MKMEYAQQPGTKNKNYFNKYNGIRFQENRK